MCLCSVFALVLCVRVFLIDPEQNPKSENNVDILSVYATANNNPREKKRHIQCPVAVLDTFYWGGQGGGGGAWIFSGGP